MESQKSNMLAFFSFLKNINNFSLFLNDLSIKHYGFLTSTISGINVLQINRPIFDGAIKTSMDYIGPKSCLKRLIGQQNCPSDSS